MKVDPSKAAMLPKMTGGENAANTTPAPVPHRQTSPIAEVAKASAQPPAPPDPPKRQPAPALAAYWMDPRGTLYRRDPVPTVILTINPAIKQAELDRILKALLEG
jgi:hypothetical protein